jgi:hypothetical protein
MSFYSLKTIYGAITILVGCALVYSNYHGSKNLIVLGSIVIACGVMLIGKNSAPP